jgi:hypothetical protein
MSAVHPRLAPVFPPQNGQVWRRRSGLTLLAVLFAALLGPVAHELAAEHETCALHGEIIDAGEGPAHAAHDTRRDTAERAAGLQSREHLHCAQLALLRAQLLLPALSEIAAPPLSTAVVVAPSSQQLPARTRLYRLAPKASPPLA